MPIRAIVALAALVTAAAPALASHTSDGKLDGVLRHRAQFPRGTSRVIIQTTDGTSPDRLVKDARGTAGIRLPLLHGQVAEVPDTELRELARHPRVRALSLDRRVRGTLERTAATVGAPFVWSALGFDGSGVGIAIIDSGVTAWHDDLHQRVVHFADFVNQRATAYDDYGHGTHVAGVVAGSGYDSNGARRGIAPGASLVVLKVLDGAGDGYISNVIAAINYAVDRRDDFNIRVINLSVAAGVYESYATDPLTLACKRAVEAGLVVVTASGNLGLDAAGRPQRGGVTAPGNAPWVLTVGATDHRQTAERSDDRVAPFSSRGPSAIDGTAKPDIVAPGVGIESLADSESLLFQVHAAARRWGAVDTAAPPYLTLTGTSMASPVVSGTIALMLQANPSLTPNLVKAILQFTAEERGAYSHLAQGGGFLNARGAVQLAQSLASSLANGAKDPTAWSRHLIWGNRRIGGGVLKASANAWPAGVVWGASAGADGEPVVWGTRCAAPECDDELWGAVEVETHEWGAADQLTADGGSVSMLEYLEPAAGDATLASRGDGPRVDSQRVVQAAVLPERLRPSRGRAGAARA
jgi:serine protease AprX